MSGHSPGPWRWDHGSGRGGTSGALLDADGYHVIIHVDGDPEHLMPDTGDARLIAAAPELLAALAALAESARRAYEADERPWAPDLEKAEALVARVRGT